MRRISMLFAVLLCGLAACSSEDAPQKERPSDTAKQESKTLNRGYDGQDPKTAGCDQPPAVDVPGSQVPVRLPNGRKIGTLVLRRSAGCQTMWGRVDGLPEKPSGKDVMHVNVKRPADDASAEFDTPDVFIAVFGDMLTYRPGCVYAEAYVSRVIREGEAKKGPVAKTSCKK